MSDSTHTALRAIQQATAVVGTLMKAKKPTPDQLHEKLIELFGNLSDATEAVLVSQGELETLRQEINGLTLALDRKPKLVMDRGVYRDETSPEKGPYCPNCFDGQGQLSVLAKLPRDFAFLEGK